MQATQCTCVIKLAATVNNDGIMFIKLINANAGKS